MTSYPYSRFTNATFAPILLYSSHVFVACDRVREECSEKGTMGEHLAVGHRSQILPTFISSNSQPLWKVHRDSLPLQVIKGSIFAYLHFFQFAPPTKGLWRFFASLYRQQKSLRLSNIDIQGLGRLFIELL
jgi:hypothetical protein